MGRFTCTIIYVFEINQFSQIMKLNDAVQNL